MSETVNDMSAFTNLTDCIMQMIMASTDPLLEKVPHSLES